MATIGITGGSGFIGGHVASLLKNKGYDVIIFSRNPQRGNAPGVTYTYWHPGTDCDRDALGATGWDCEPRGRRHS